MKGWAKCEGREGIGFGSRTAKVLRFTAASVPSAHKSFNIMHIVFNVNVGPK
ncbi:hypothetical protein FQZ97_623550 [compost metagenome]